MMSCVPSVEPVSAISQWLIRDSTLWRQCLMTCALFFTVMHRQFVARWVVVGNCRNLNLKIIKKIIIYKKCVFNNEINY